MKITTRCGSEVIEALNEALLAKAAEGKLLRVGKVRADTTVVSADVDSPAPAARTTAGPPPGAPGRSPRSCGYAARRPKTRRSG